VSCCHFTLIEGLFPDTVKNEHVE
jgi:hypothetical protein